jgi:hypothetical protein
VKVEGIWSAEKIQGTAVENKTFVKRCRVALVALTAMMEKAVTVFFVPVSERRFNHA